MNSFDPVAATKASSTSLLTVIDRPAIRVRKPADDSEQKAIGKEDFHDAAVGGAEGLENADVAGFLGDDHAEDRQDAEARHADDHEEEHIENALLDFDGLQSGPCLSSQVLMAN